MLNGMTCVFRDVTLEEAADVAALQSLHWGKDILPRESSLILADVKGPAGCSEWKHKANELPLDVVWEHPIEEELALHSAGKKRSITSWFRDDYSVCELILLNPKWKCMPSLCHSRTSVMPVVLSCRDHSIRTKGHMFHPCRHPLPVIASEKSNQFASIVPVPRTLRKSQLSAYSASFQVAKMQGHTGVLRICIRQNEHRHRRRKRFFVSHSMTDQDSTLRTPICLLLPHNDTSSSKLSVFGS